MREFCDMHCHLIPEVDDGAQSIEVSLAALKMEYEAGVRTMILTPHFRKGMFETPREIVFRQFVYLEMEAEKLFPDLKLYLGCEYHVHHDMVEELNTSRYYRINGSSYVLTEFSGQHTKEYIRKSIQDLVNAGFLPIIAHIERYSACAGDFSFMRELKEVGCLIQVNADSVIGKSGWGLKRITKKMIKENLVDVIGSDAHNVKRRAPHMEECREYLDKTFGQEVTDRLMHDTVIRLIRHTEEEEFSTHPSEVPQPDASDRKPRQRVVVEEPEL